MKHTLVVCAVGFVFSSGVAEAGDGGIRRAKKPRLNSYIAVLADDIIDEVEVIAADLAQSHKATVVGTYKYTFKGFAFEGSESAARAISRDKSVKSVEEDGEIAIATTVVPRSWATDRIDNRVSPRLDGAYTYCSTGRGVRVYVVDTGIWADHDEFSNPDPISGGRRVVSGFDHHAKNTGTANMSADPCRNDRLTGQFTNGSHGTAVASLIGGRTLGVATEVTMVAVRVLYCGGVGYQRDVLNGLEWIPTDPDYVPGQGRVINLSGVYEHGFPDNTSSTGVFDGGALESSVQSLLNGGMTFVASAGNQNQAVAQKYSPARMPGIITVGGTQGRNPNDSDARWETNSTLGSNYGPVIDLFAPADRVLTAYWTSPTATRDPNDPFASSGTSFSSALVAGAAARLLEFYPGETCAQIRDRLVNDATSDLHGLNILNRMDSPNRLLITSSFCRRRAASN